MAVSKAEKAHEPATYILLDVERQAATTSANREGNDVADGEQGSEKHVSNNNNVQHSPRSFLN